MPFAIIRRAGQRKASSGTHPRLRAAAPLVVLLGVLAGIAAPRSGRTALPSARLLANLPLSFLENRGQLDPQVRYYLLGRDTSVYFRPCGLTFALGTSRLSMGHGAASRQEQAPPYALKLDFVGASENVRPVGEERTSAVVSYFHGPRSQWKTGLKSYAAVLYRDLWPGIDLRYSGAQDRIKYEFVVHPGADPAQIRLAYRGASGLQVNPDGELQVETPARAFHDARPYAYQEAGARKQEVPSAYVVEPTSASAAHPYHFRLGAYDRSKTLVLDPTVLLYAGYIGGAGAEEVTAAAVDGAGNAYIAGGTTSNQGTFPNGTGFASLPGVPGPDQTYNAGSRDAFVAKVKADGSGLVYAGYIGGSDADGAFGIAVDPAGAAYVVGYTMSTEATFPVRGGPDLTYNGNSQFGAGDAFIAKVRPDGTALDYCGYIGGSAGDQASGVALDPQGNAYVTGQTQSTETTFPVRAGPDLTYNGGGDAFVAKVQSDGAALVYCGYVGGSGADSSAGIAVDSAGSAYVAGFTQSNEGTFPVIGGPDLSYNDTAEQVGDAFVAKVRPIPSSADPRNNLEFCGYIGGASRDEARGIAIDGQRNVYVTGVTDSAQSSLPVKVGPDLTYNGLGDAFAAAIRAVPNDPNVFNNFIYCGYIGGSQGDAGNGIAVDEGGAAYITGFAGSDPATFPVKDGPRLFRNGDSFEAFVAKVQPGGADLEYAGYIGGSSADQTYAIAVDRAGNAFVGGSTLSPGAELGVAIGPDLTFNGQSDGFIVKVGRSQPAGNQPPVFTTCPDPVSLAATSAQGASVTLAAAVTDPDRETLVVTWNVDGGPVEKTVSVPPGGPPTTASLSFAQTYAVGTHTVVISVSDGTAAPVTCSTTVTITAPVLTLTNCVVSPRTFPAAGGAATISVDVTGSEAVASVAATVTRTGSSPATVTLTRSSGNTFRGTFNAPVNKTSTILTYAVAVRAMGVNGANASATCDPITVAAADTRPPTLARCTVAPRALPSSGGVVTLSVDVTTTAELASVAATVTPPSGAGAVIPVTLTRTAGTTFRGTFTARGNPTSSVRTYRVSIAATTVSGTAATVNCDPFTVAAADLQPPVLSGCDVSPRSLPPTGGSVTLLVIVFENVSLAKVAANLSLAGTTTSVTLARITGNRFFGTFRAPANTSHDPQNYAVVFTATDTSGNQGSVNCGQVSVGGIDDIPPVLTNCTVEPRSVLPRGGAVNLKVLATDNVAVSRVTVEFTAGGVTTPVTLSAAAGRGYVGAFQAPPNKAPDLRTYTVTVIATDTSGNRLTAPCGEVTQGGGALTRRELQRRQQLERAQLAAHHRQESAELAAKQRLERQESTLPQRELRQKQLQERRELAVHQGHESAELAAKHRQELRELAY